MTCHVWNSDRTLRIGRLVKAARPDLIVVIGGPDVGPRARRVLDANPWLDAVALGEGEEALRLLLRRLTGLDPGEWTHTPGFAVQDPSVALQREPLVDLDRTPSLLDDPEFLVNHGSLVIESSRGCRFACGFCMWASTRRRDRSLRIILEEIRRFSALGGGRLDIIDAGLNQDPPRLLAVMAALEAAGNIQLGAIELNLEDLDDEAAVALSKVAGRLAIGLETTRPAALKAMSRRYDPRRFRDRAELLVRLGSSFQLDLIYGLPGDDHAGFCQSLDEAYSLGAALVIPFRLQVLPGSRYERQADKWSMKYTPTPWYWVLENATYSEEDIERSTRLALANDLMHTFTFATSAFQLAIQELGQPPSGPGGWREPSGTRNWRRSAPSAHCPRWGGCCGAGWTTPAAARASPVCLRPWPTPWPSSWPRPGPAPEGRRTPWLPATTPSGRGTSRCSIRRPESTPGARARRRRGPCPSFSPCWWG